MAIPESVTTSPVGSRAPRPKPYRSKALSFLSEVVSVLFHPVFFPSIMAVLLYFIAKDQFAGVPRPTALRWFATIVLQTLFFPLLTVAMLRGLGFLKSWKMEDTRERIIPLIAVMTLYFWVSYVFLHIADDGKSPMPPRLLQIMLLGSFYGVIAMFMANIFFKISLHTTAAGGMIGLMSIVLWKSPANMLVVFLASLLLAGVIGTARLLLGAHKPGDLIAGYVAGFVAMWAAWGYLA